MPHGYVLAPRPCDAIRSSWTKYGVARTKVTGQSAIRLHFCDGHFVLADLQRCVSDLRNYRLTTASAPQVKAIYACKAESLRNVYTVAKKLRTQLVSYARFCELVDTTIITLELQAVDRVSPSELAR